MKLEKLMSGEKDNKPEGHTLTVRMEKRTFEQFRQICKENNVTVSGAIKAMIADFNDNYKK